jgi:superfamily II DNA helicase RecQ
MFVGARSILLVVKTSTGKSYDTWTIGVLLGVCLNIMPLLALRTDQMAKLTPYELVVAKVINTRQQQLHVMTPLLFPKGKHPCST